MDRYKQPVSHEVEVIRAFLRDGVVVPVGTKLVLPWPLATELKSGGKVRYVVSAPAKTEAKPEAKPEPKPEAPKAAEPVAPKGK